ncbi:Aorsin [Talaromyces atroroseus]|uniref:Aorsin n=1 Tax=Talaromyces atroroseus TaxID=1441469 RepID=A0A225AUU7_TALAT|nr:Aorsin [Talaromyces atroroseus]OKL59359.1 Aorsin [Talaromyces atroroseus]
MKVHLSTLALGLAIVAAAVPAPQSHVVHEKRSSAPSKWVNVGRVDPMHNVVVRIGLKQSNLHRGYEYLMDVSHPESPNFGKHWTPEQVVKAFAPSDDTVAQVRAWLTNAGIDESRVLHTENQGWLAFPATAAEAEALLHTEYYHYEHEVLGTKALACEQYHVPQAIQEHIDYINPGIGLPVTTKEKPAYGKRATKRSSKFTRPRKFRSVEDWFGSDLANCDVQITPDCVAALYEIPPANQNVNPNNSLGIFEEGDYYAQEDLNLFFRNLSSNIPQGTHPIPAFIDGAEAPVNVSEAGGESDLDFELAFPIIYPQTITLYQTDDSNYALADTPTSGFFNTFLDALDGSYCTYCAFGECGDDPNLDPVYPDPSAGGYKGQLMCGVYKPTNVISISYGGQESDLPAYYQQRQCNDLPRVYLIASRFLKLGLQGVSILVASGDDGVAGPPGDDSANGCLGSNSTIFSPAFPNSCPYITNVGATKVYPGHTVWEPESAVVDPAGHPYTIAFSSGGGFSNIYPIPDYQAAAVANYFENYNPPYPYYEGNASFGKNGGLYNRIGRGYPDVAANGDNIATWNEGTFGLSGGTSASTPIFSSVINRIIEERLAIGKGSLGFLNPTLYSNAWALNDITNGTNPGCGTEGFSTAPGWDPVTGLGTPNYPRLLALFLSLP